MSRYKCQISYDGTNYVGWQRQLTGLSIQELIEEALTKFLREPIVVVGASRTDSGVHALGQVAHFTSHEMIDVRKFLFSVNNLLPRDIRISSLELVSDQFHAQYSAISKLYYYHLYLAREDSPFNRLYHYHIPFSISLDRLQEALQLFVGHHDFTSFTNCGSSAKTFERTIFRMSLEEEGNQSYRIACEGDGFLYKMVRNMVGSALLVAKGKCSLEDLLDILHKKDRKKAPPPAPSRGLFLINVNYSSEISSKEEK